MSNRPWRWAYTLVNETVTDSEGNNRAAIFMGWTRGLPQVAHEVMLDELHNGPPRLWWLPQDLAIGGGLVVSALRVAVQLRVLPVLDGGAVAATDEVALVCAREIFVPSYHGALSAPLTVAVRDLRQALSDLLAGEATESAVVRCSAMIERLAEDFPPSRRRSARLSLLRFPDLVDTRAYPALLLAGQ